MVGYGAIAANDEAANNFYMVHFTSVPYILQENVVSDRNKLSSGDLVCNTIYTYPGWHKSRFYVDPFTRQKNMTVSMNTVSIPNLDVRVWTWKLSFYKGIFYVH